MMATPLPQDQESPSIPDKIRDKPIIRYFEAILQFRRRRTLKRVRSMIHRPYT
jgi:hypothetical protein